MELTTTRHDGDHIHDEDCESEHHGAPEQAESGKRGFGPIVLLVPIAVALLARNRVDAFTNEDVRLWSTLFVSVTIQALPFLVLGVVISGLIAAFLSPELVERLLPKRKALAVPTAGRRQQPEVEDGFLLANLHLR